MTEIKALSLFQGNPQISEKKGFWRWEAKHLHWKIRYQGAKYCRKIKAYWEELAVKGIQSPMYCSFTVSLPNEVVEQFVDNEDY